MKNYNVVASKEPVASFSMDYTTYKMKFPCTTKCANWIVSQNPELDCAPWDFSIEKDDKIVFTFYSIGNLIIEEEK